MVVSNVFEGGWNRHLQMGVGWDDAWRLLPTGLLSLSEALLAARQLQCCGSTSTRLSMELSCPKRLAHSLQHLDLLDDSWAAANLHQKQASVTSACRNDLYQCWSTQVHSTCTSSPCAAMSRSTIWRWCVVSLFGGALPVLRSLLQATRNSAATDPNRACSTAHIREHMNSRQESRPPVPTG